MIKKPMLADKAEDISDIKLPALVSDKIDGIRCIKVNGKALTRSFKPIPNKFVREWIEANLPDGIDGELTTRGNEDFNSVQSAIMKTTGTPDFVFCAFDLVTEDLKEQFITRYDTLVAYYHQLATEEAKTRLKIVEQLYVTTLSQLAGIELDAFNRGCEGIMLRKPDGPYKCGRSTVKEGYLLKYKRWVDEEGEITGFIEQMHNENDKEEDGFGDTKRSSKLEGMVPANTLGVIAVKRLVNGMPCKIGTGIGLTKALRQEIWDNRDQYIGKLVRFKHQVSPNDPVDMDPRFPSFQGFRHPDDMSN